MMYQRASLAVVSALILSIVGVAGLSGRAEASTPTASAPEAATDASGATDAAAAEDAPANPAPANPVPVITVPPASTGVWYDLGTYQAPWLSGDGPVPVTGANAPTRVVGWRRQAANSADSGDSGSNADDWLAIVIVQIAPGASAPCAEQTNILNVTDSGPGCLRLRRNADFDGWMQVAQPVLYRWVDEHGWNSRPRAWVAYRIPSANGGALEVHALIAPSLIEPVTRNTTDFITSGVPGQQWARQLAAAARETADASNNGTLVVPPFPFAPAPRAEPEAALPDVMPTTTSSPASAPAEAEQVTAPAAAPAPRQDRE